MYIAIAKIVDNTGKKVLGWRLLDLSSYDNTNSNSGVGAVADKTNEECKAAMLRQPKCIVNLELKPDGSILGNNGSANRYTSINVATGEVSNASLVVLYRLEKEGFICANYDGAIRKLSSDNAVMYAKSTGIANGKIVNRGGKDFLCSIKGEYSVLPSNLMALNKKAKKTDYILMSDDEQVQVLYNKIKAVKNQANKGVVGKLGYDTTDRLIIYVIKEGALLDSMKSGNTDEIQRIIKDVLTDIKVISKVGDTGAVKYHCKGLSGIMDKAGEKEKKMYNRLASGKGVQSKVNFSS